MSVARFRENLLFESEESVLDELEPVEVAVVPEVPVEVDDVVG